MTAQCRYLPVLLISWLCVSSVSADTDFPLASCDVSSPRTTLESFQRITGQAATAMQSGDQAAQRHVEDIVAKAMRCLNVSEIPSQRVDDKGEASVLLLQEVLDRLDLPPYVEIPDAEQMRSKELSRWVIPNTEIEIAQVKEGPREGEWLFSPETVARLKAFYEDVSDHPYRPDAIWGTIGPLGGVYTYYVLMPESSMPSEWIDDLPDWARTVYLEQPVWKWVGIALVLAITVAVFALIYRFARRASQARLPDQGLYWHRLVTPIAGVVLALVAEHLIDEYINSVGYVDGIGETSLWIIALFFSAWAILALGEIVADLIIRSPSVQSSSIDASLIRISSRLISFGITFWVVLEGAETLGLSLIPLFAGLGVGGLAIALAVRPTFENVIGGLILFIDKPVRIGERCIFGNQEGFVEQIGLRSTRIRTLKDTLVSIPNAEFSQLQLENISRRRMTLYQTVLGLRYETTADQLRYVLARLREMLAGHPMVARERLRVRFLRFGEYSLDLEIFAYLRTDDFDQYWAMREDLNLRIMDIVKAAGTSFAFPSSTAYLGKDGGLDDERSRAAEARVKEWRDKNALPFPELDDAQRAAIEDELDYPPKGSAQHSGDKSV